MAAEPPTTDSDSCPQCGHEVGDAWLVCAWCGQQLAAPAELAEGSLLADGRYQILRVIGRGGFGITYEVADRRLERHVAMKELFPDSAVRHGSVVLTPPAGRAGFKAARERFLREARVLARFTHPGIVRVFEVFEEHGTAYLVMELLEGRTLIDLLRQHGRPFGEDDVIDVAGRVAAALRPVHAAGVLHRDVNPSNVMMTHHGRIVVIDFGLARDFDQDRTAGMTRVVTPGYAPLEQYRGEARFGPPTDVYGLAATLYRLSTGKVPVAALERSAGALLPPPHRINPEISKAVSDALLDGLELDLAHRPRDLDTFLSRLGSARLPEGPRARLLDTVPITAGGDPSIPTSVVGSNGVGPVVLRTSGPADGPGGGVERDRAGVGHHGSGSGRADQVGASAIGSSVDDLGSDHTVIDPACGGRPVPEADRAALLHGHVPDHRGGPVPDGTHVLPASDGAGVGAGGWGAVGGTDRPAAVPPVSPARPAELDGTVALPPSSVHLSVGSPPEVLGGSPSSADRRGASGAPVSSARSTHDPRLGLAVGPHRPGRKKLTVPLVVVAIAFGAAAPVLAASLLVLVVLPWLATYGDSVAHRLRAEHGVAGGWAERRVGPSTLAPVRFVRNVVVAVLRASPIVGVGAVALAGWYGLESIDPPRALLHLALRAIGATVAGLLVLASREGSHRFRTGLGLDELVTRFVPGGRTTERVVIFWLLAAALAAGALWLTPSTFPLP